MFSASTLSPSRGACRSRGHVSDVFWTQIDTSGGASDTEVNVLAAMPVGVPSMRAHTAVTPDGKHPKVRLSAAAWEAMAGRPHEVVRGNSGATDANIRS